MNLEFLIAWNITADGTHTTAVEHGWDDPNQNQGEVLALIHSEISEALEALRKDNPPSEKIPDFSHAEEELADAVIRIMNMGETNGWDMAGAIVAKAAYNKTRPYKHGGKKF